MSFYRVLVFIFLMFGIFAGHAQRMRYKDLFPVIQKSDEEVAIMTMKAFLSEEPDHANANFLLGKYYLKKFRSADKLTEFPLAKAAAEQSQLRWIKSALLIDEREVRRNNEFYLDQAGNEMEYGQVKSFIDSAHHETDQFLELGLPIYQSFIQTIRHYDNAVKIYALIAEEFNSQDELLLLYDESVEKRLDSLVMHYDSTLFYLNRYFQLEGEYDMGYQQQYYIQPLSVFKLQGLVASINFLDPEIRVWNYKSWVNEIKSVFQNELMAIRKKLIENDSRITAELKKAEPETSLLDKETIFRLGKFDFGSLPMALLQYKDLMLEWKKSASRTAFYDSSKNILSQNKLVFYTEMINRTLKADTLLSRVEAKNNQEDVQKHLLFIDSRYGGKEGLKTFVSEETGILDSEFESYAKRLQNLLIRNYTNSVVDSGMVVLYRGAKYPAYISPLNWQGMDLNTPQTLLREETADGSVYYAGLTKISEGKSVAYIIRSSNGRVEWINEYEIALDSLEEEAIHLPGAMTVSREGVSFIIYSRNPEGTKVANTFITLNNSGDQKLFRHLDNVSLFPGELKYEESNNRFLIIFNGEWNAEETVNSQIVQMDQSGLLQWTTRIEYAGHYLNTVILNSGYVFLANASRFGDLDRENLSVLAVKMGRNGQILNQLWVENKGGFQAGLAVRTLQNINLIGGLNGNADTNKPHLIIDPFLNIIYLNQ